MKLKPVFRKMTIFSLLVFALLSICGCNILKDKQMAEEVTNKVYTIRQTQDYKAILPYYDQAFFSQTSEEEWEKMLTVINHKLGNIKDWKLEQWSINAMTNGTYFRFVYTVNYEQYPGVETITLQKKKGTYKIINQNIDSKGLLLEE